MRTSIFLLALTLGFHARAQTASLAIHLTDSPKPAELQEVATVLRSVLGVRDLSVDNENATLTVRGTVAETAGAEWLIRDFELPEEIRPRAPHERTMTDRRLPPLVRVFYLRPDTTQLQLQELLTVLRVVGGAQQIFSVTRHNAIVARGTKAELEMWAWILGELQAERAAADRYTGTHQFRGEGKDSMVRIFYPESREKPEFARLFRPLRSQLSLTHAFLTTAPEALVLRGTPDQMDAAEKAIGVR